MPQEPEGDAATDLARRRVLVIDDDRVFAEIVFAVLERSGCSVVAETDPRAGLALAIDGGFDLVLLDLMMPGMRGEEVLGLLKPLALGLPVVVVSASDEAEARARTRDLGAAGYVRKPIDPHAFARLLGDILGSREGRAAKPPDGAPRGFDRAVAFVFGGGPYTPGRRTAAAGIVSLLLGVLAALLLA